MTTPEQVFGIATLAVQCAAQAWSIGWREVFWMMVLIAIAAIAWLELELG